MASATDIFSKLTAEHQPGFFYRGQAGVAPGPLWPSAYRSQFRSEDCLTITTEERGRGCGSRFNLCMYALDWRPFANEQAYNAFVLHQQLKRFVMSYVRNALGYPLAEAVFQHAGMRSEALDVTSDPRVAMMFATHDWTGSQYRRKGGQSEPSVIYRWRLPTSHWTIDDLNRYDFFSCPTIIPVHEVMAAFQRGADQSAFDQSIERYRSAIGWGVRFDLDAIKGRRPFDLLRMPPDFDGSRVARQHSALLLPDFVTAEEFLRYRRVSVPAVEQEIRSGIFLEDLAQREGCETLLFETHGLDQLDWLDDAVPSVLFPPDQIAGNLVRGWVRRLVEDAQGATPVFPTMPEGIDPASLVDLIAKDFETEFFL